MKSVLFFFTLVQIWGNYFLLQLFLSLWIPFLCFDHSKWVDRGLTNTDPNWAWPVVQVQLTVYLFYSKIAVVLLRFSKLLENGFSILLSSYLWEKSDENGESFSDIYSRLSSAAGQISYQNLVPSVSLPSVPGNTKIRLPSSSFYYRPVSSSTDQIWGTSESQIWVNKWISRLIGCHWRLLAERVSQRPIYCSKCVVNGWLNELQTSSITSTSFHFRASLPPIPTLSTLVYKLLIILLPPSRFGLS